MLVNAKGKDHAVDQILEWNHETKKNYFYYCYRQIAEQKNLETVFPFITFRAQRNRWSRAYLSAQLSHNPLII